MDKKKMWYIIGTVILLLGIGGLFFKAHSDGVAQRERLERQKKEEALEAKKKNDFYKLPGVKKKTEDKEVTNSDVKEALLNDGKEQKTTVTNNEKITPQKPAQKVLDALASDPIDWSNMYLRKQEMLYILQNVLAIPATSIDVQSGLITINLTADDFKNVKSISSTYDPVISKLYTHSSYSSERNTFNLVYVNTSMAKDSDGSTYVVSSSDIDD